MVGPAVLLVVGVVAGSLAGGVAGAVTGGLLALFITAAVAAGAAIWAQQVGNVMVREDALANAPCPPGFKRLCARVYAVMLRE